MAQATKRSSTDKEKALVIVESPAKARTIAGFLGSDFTVESSIGHIRDLPKSAADIPIEVKKQPWARLGVDVDNGFKPLYVVSAEKKQHIQKLKQLTKEADLLYLATDEDREGESIAWHLLEVLNPKIPVKRMVFHEITKRAINEAIAHPRDIDRRLVDAQEARRILDRLVGYEVSPVLWKKVMPKLSAGRVQSVATRVLVERERERIRFRTAKYWDIEGTFSAKALPFAANLIQVDGKRIATGKDFGEDGKTKNDVLVLAETETNQLVAELGSGNFKVKSVEKKPYRRSPYPPFMTSTLQQEAGRKLRFSAARAMKAAQRLYEAGYITYMRTDSTTLSSTAINAARTHIGELYGADYLPKEPRVYANKVKNAQEAHEAIRPAGDSWKLPEDVEREVGYDEAKVYELIWKRTVASQMQDARGESVQARITALLKGSPHKEAEFSASGNTLSFPGFYRAYVEGSDDPDAELENREKHLPELNEGESLSGTKFEPKAHETQPPARYTEASLVKRLEELGVGRPSTYASILSTVQDRGYVWKKGTALVPSYTAFAVVSLLEQHFPELVNYAFTAKMEDDLDAIASGSEQSTPWLTRFYFGVQEGVPSTSAGSVMAGQGLKSMVSDNLGDIDARAINSIPVGVDQNGVDIIARVGRYGPYVQRGEDTCSIPEDLAPDELTPEKAMEMLSAPQGDRAIGTDPESEQPVFVKSGRYGTYVQLGEGGKDTKPKTASIFRSMTAESVTLGDALKLLSLPRSLGKDGGIEVVAQNGRYGPYIQKGTDSRSLTAEEDLFTVTMQQALELLAKPKEGRMRRAAKPPIKELGLDPASGKAITVRDGRFGPYVTDGETIASLRKGDSPEGLSPDRAHELLAEKRGQEPRAAKKKAKSRGTKAPAKAKATTSSSPTAKKAAKKTSKKAPKKAKAEPKASAAE